ncbi:glycoside hydrolase family 3 protein [Gracilinema caldarium]|uniref:beta-N-acetylhexosaminidase n=1 Tax=Gracilinema caldarium (strain ATCC 51460 / DSM 7334 / H1) TaxID=744872 RepID=F8F0D4_GRAC1|nr:glycoside hydrolase family 3 protein [Gracilinema caldarium]AEJ18998.1 glycoside hydrolase family 3 domain protein [Gracilinema caldarium DSM 7334]
MILRAYKKVFIAILLVLFSLQSYRGFGAEHFYSPGKPEELAEKLLAAMSDEEALAQTFMLGWVGADPSPAIIDWIQKRHIGGIKIFGWNTEDTYRLANTVGVLQKAAQQSDKKIPLLVATDQEGGWIRHVKGITSETPGNMAIGASGVPRDAYLSGYYIGRELAALGINMNFAPSVDLFTNQQSVLIGPRAFSDNPVTAGILGIAFAKGLEKAGVIPTAKHYPGHGDTELDSHGILPHIQANFETLWNRELLPYRMLSKEGIPAIMTGHLAFPNTRGGSEPASLSRWFITTILRETIGFKGLVITDDLLMNGVTIPAGSLSRAAKLALEAGNDILMMSKTPNLSDPVWNNLLDAMKREPKFRERVRDAARRTLILKLTHLKGDTAPPLFPQADEIKKRIPDPQGKAFFLDLAARSITLVSGTDPSPLEPSKAGKVLLAASFEDFLSVGLLAYPNAQRFKFSYSEESSPQDKLNFQSQAKQADTIIFCLANGYGVDLLQSIRYSGKRVIVISALSPVYLQRVTWNTSGIAVYSYSRESFIAVFSALLGRIPMQGKLPFAMKNLGR